MWGVGGIKGENYQTQGVFYHIFKRTADSTSTDRAGGRSSRVQTDGQDFLGSEASC